MLLVLAQLRDAPLAVILQYVTGILTAALVGMTVHEFAHNYVAHLMGDPVPSKQNRLTLNPAVHIDPRGFLMFILIGFGTLGSAPIASHRMRNPRWGFLAAVAAGPISNLLLATVTGLVLRVLIGGELNPSSGLFIVLNMFVFFNLLLFIFNLIPLFPLDGWHIVLSLLPADLAYTWQRNAQTTQYIFFFLLILGFTNILPPNLDPFNIIISEPLAFLYRLIVGI